jgi:hypothetical protein
MTMPTRSPQTTTGRSYDIGGVRYPSVTTILSAIAKPQLLPWAAGLERTLVSSTAADLYAEHLATPATLTRAAYLTRLQTRLGPARAHTTALATAGDIGSECHRLIEWTMRTALGAYAGPKPAARGAAYVALRAFEAWATSVSLKPMLLERVIHSSVYGYAGTLDLLARVNGVVTVIDFKSSRKIYSEAHLQVAAYQAALVGMGYLPPTGGGLIIRLPKTELDGPDVEVVQTAPFATLLPVFLAAKEIWAYGESLR